MKGHLVGNGLDSLEKLFKTAIFLLLQFMAVLMVWIGWTLEKSAPRLLSWSAKLRAFALNGLDVKVGETKGDSPEEKITKPDRPENQSSRSGHHPKIWVTPLSTEPSPDDTLLEEEFELEDVKTSNEPMPAGSNDDQKVQETPAPKETDGERAARIASLKTGLRLS